MSEFQLFAVTGNPILHSKSPGMFNSAFEADQIPATYTRLAADSAQEAIKVFRSLGLKGMNVTAPFKEEIMPLLDEVDESAQFIGGVNTIVNKNGKLKGYNTDWIGVLRPIENQLSNTTLLKDKKCLIIGASGAGKAAAFAMKINDVKITIVNRTIEKAEQVAKNMGCEYAGLDNLSELIPQADIIVIALTQNVNPINESWLSKKHIIFDANYKDSKIIEMAKRKGCTIINATDWLLFQGMKAFEYFLPYNPDYNSMKAGLSTYNLHSRSDKIALIGFMGSGKTTVGKKLAKKMAIPFVDTDELIVEREGKTISEIFELHGEAYFRSCEKEILQSIINTPGKQIISCGGGMAINDENRALLKKHCLVLWLYATPEATVKRIKLETRPLLNVENPLEKALTLFGERKVYYAKASDVIFNTEKFDAESISDKIIDEIRRIQ
jgi:shikimate dehydrogenase